MGTSSGDRLNSKLITHGRASASCSSVGKKQSKRVQHNPDSVANIQRQLDPPLAFDPTVKKLTN